MEPEYYYDNFEVNCRVTFKQCEPLLIPKEDISPKFLVFEIADGMLQLDNWEFVDNIEPPVQKAPFDDCSLVHVFMNVPAITPFHNEKDFTAYLQDQLNRDNLQVECIGYQKIGETQAIIAVTAREII